MIKKLVFCCWVVGLAIFATTTAHANDLTLAWDLNPDPRVAGYRLYCGTASGEYNIIVDAGLQETAVMSGLKPNTTYYIAVTAYDANQNESDFSEEIIYKCKSGPGNKLQVILMLLEDD